MIGMFALSEVLRGVVSLDQHGAVLAQKDRQHLHRRLAACCQALLAAISCAATASAS